MTIIAPIKQIEEGIDSIHRAGFFVISYCAVSSAAYRAGIATSEENPPTLQYRRGALVAVEPRRSGHSVFVMIPDITSGVATKKNMTWGIT